jgi:hypothetical protein
MKLEEIQQHWERDSTVDRTELGEESLRIPQLHSKYFKFFSAERLLLRKMEYEYKSLHKEKCEYYAGTLDENTLNANGWEPFALRVLRADIPMYLDSDTDIRNASLKIKMQEEKVEFLESILKSLPNRGYQIAQAIAWEKFKVGA